MRVADEAKTIATVSSIGAFTTVPRGENAVTSDEYNGDAWALNMRSRTIIDAEAPRKVYSAEDARRTPASHLIRKHGGSSKRFATASAMIYRVTRKRT